MTHQASVLVRMVDQSPRPSERGAQFSNSQSVAGLEGRTCRSPGRSVGFLNLQAPVNSSAAEANCVANSCFQVPDACVHRRTLLLDGWTPWKRFLLHYAPNVPILTFLKVRTYLSGMFSACCAQHFMVLFGRWLVVAIHSLVATLLNSIPDK